ncbi:hypothetical protein P4119_17440 [Pseudomonas aeruginosa]|nr:hypothetical protein [Pseudomonas aeruginosa]
MKGSGSDTTRAIFSALAGITRKTLFGYESGERAPDALALAAWAKSGLDVLYVVTGQRQGVPAPAPAQSRRPFSPDERILLDNYRHSPPDAQGRTQGDERCVRATFEEENGMTNKGRQMDFKVLLGAVMLAGLSVAGCSTKTMADSRN